ncbi:MAG: DUF169 domain-containing protein [Desulfatirhabdiaceae bacterium]
MQSHLSDALQLKHQPVAIIWSDQKPDHAMQFSEGKWGCVMWLAASAARGKPAVCDRKTFGCFGGGVGMGFGLQYKNFPGGEACFCHFLSSGNDQWETGRQAAEQVKPYMTKESHDNFVHGERYFKNPELVQKFIASLPMTDIPSEYVVFKPLPDADSSNDNIQTIVFFANPDQLSALVILANYGRGDNLNVIIPYAAGCQTIGIYPYQEAKSAKPRGVVGLTDISARVYIQKQLGADLFTFAMPFALFTEMEANVEGSFLQRHTWHALVK